MTPTTRPQIRMDSVVLDTDEPQQLGRFYARLLGWRIAYDGDDWVTLVGDGGAALAFQLAINHVRPTWPAHDVPQQVHLDFEVTDLDAAGALAESLGATRASKVRSPEDSFDVFLDPSGHPFCLCSTAAPGTSTAPRAPTVSP